MSCLYIQQIPAIDCLAQNLSNLDCASLLKCNSRLAKQHASHPVFACRHASNSFISVCESGNLAAVKWLHLYSASCDAVTDDAMVYSASCDAVTDDAMDFAAAEGHLAVVQWLHANRTEGCTHFAMDWAAQFGHFDVVCWLHENRTEGCTEYAMNMAASLDIVEWLYRNVTDVFWGYLPIQIFERKGRYDLVQRYRLWKKEHRFYLIK